MTISDLLREVEAILRKGTPSDAKAYMAHYIAQVGDDRIAKENVGYLTGYMNATDAARTREWFDVAHPVFGTEEVSPDAALKAGMALGKAVRKGESHEEALRAAQAAMRAQHLVEKLPKKVPLAERLKAVQEDRRKESPWNE